jgi:hypothetical protein
VMCALAMLHVTNTMETANVMMDGVMLIANFIPEIASRNATGVMVQAPTSVMIPCIRAGVSRTPSTMLTVTAYASTTGPETTAQSGLASATTSATVATAQTPMTAMTVLKMLIRTM